MRTLTVEVEAKVANEVPGILIVQSSHITIEASSRNRCTLSASDGFYPTAHKVDSDYASGAAPALKERLSSAGRRLATLLNKALAAS